MLPASDERSDPCAQLAAGTARGPEVAQCCQQHDDHAAGGSLLKSLEGHTLPSPYGGTMIGPPAPPNAVSNQALASASLKLDYVLYHPASKAVASVLPVSNGKSNVAMPLAPSSPPSNALTPQQILTAYGINSIVGNGAGQTIAIVNAYDDPNIVSDLQTFDAQFNLPACNFTKINQDGIAGDYPTAAGSSGWSVEIALDVEWAALIAPGASIVLVEANSPSIDDLLTAVNTAASYAGVSVVSMSWGADESSLGNMSVTTRTSRPLPATRTLRSWRLPATRADRATAGPLVQCHRGRRNDPDNQ